MDRSLFFRIDLHTSKCASNQVIPFSLVNRAKAMVPIDLYSSSACKRLSDSHGRVYDIEALEEEVIIQRTCSYLT